MSDHVTNDNKITEGVDSRFLISDLCDLVGTYMDPDQVKEVYNAYLFGAHAHEGQIRVSGEPYIYHPLAVAKILASMHMDVKSIIASILHDVLEDTEATLEDLEERFGRDVADLVDGVSKIGRHEYVRRDQAQAETFRKLILASARDIRPACRTHRRRV